MKHARGVGQDKSEPVGGIEVLHIHNLKHIQQVPLVALVHRGSGTPTLLDFLLPGFDLLIWPKEGRFREPQESELRQAVLCVLEQVIEAPADEPGVVSYEIGKFVLFAFRNEFRSELLAEMGLSKPDKWKTF